MPTPAVVNDLSIEYTPPGLSKVTLGGTSGQYLLLNKIVIDRTGQVDGVPTCVVEAEVLVTDPTEAQFATYCATLATAFTTPQGVLAVKLGGQTLESFDPSANTGFNADVSISKPGHEYDTARSRYYRIRIEVKLPAPITANEGRIYARIEISYSTSRVRTLSMSGTYTALGSNSSEVQYRAKIGAYVGTVQQALTTGSVWKRLSETFRRGETNKILEFTHVSRELIFSEKDGSGVTADPDLTQTNLSFGRTQFAPGDSFTLGTVVRLEEVVASYSAAVDKDVTVDLKSKYASSIRPWMLKNVQAAFPGTFALVDETGAQYDPVNNNLSAHMRFLVANGGKILECRVTTQDHFDAGAILTAVWAKNPLTKDDDQGAQSKIRTITKTRRVLGTFGPGSGPGGVGAASAGNGDGAAQDQFGIFAIGAALKFDFVQGDGIPKGQGSAGGGGGNGAGGTTGGDTFGSGLDKRTLWTDSSATPLRIGRDGLILDVTDLVDVEVIAFYVKAGGGGGDKVATGAAGKGSGIK
jgi:hypothetical protein